MAHRRSSFRARGISDSQRRKKTWTQIKQLVDGAQIPGFVTNFAIDITSVGVPGIGITEGQFLVEGDGTANFPLKSALPEECTILRIRGSLSFPKTSIK